MLGVINETINNPNNTVKLTYFSNGYQTLLSFWSLVGLTDSYPELQAICDFGSVTTFEIHTDPVYNYTIRYSFKNGTDGGTSLTSYSIMNQSIYMPVTNFTELMQPLAVNNLTMWCKLCNNTQSNGCQYVNPPPPQKNGARTSEQRQGNGYEQASYIVVASIAYILLLS